MMQLAYLFSGRLLPFIRESNESARILPIQHLRQDASQNLTVVENGRKNGEYFHIIPGYSLSLGNIIGGVFFVVFCKFSHVRDKPSS
jgi:hypothetical protein